MNQPKSSSCTYEDVRSFIRLFNLYQSESPAMREVVENMAAVFGNTEADASEKYTAMTTLVDALNLIVCSVVLTWKEPKDAERTVAEVAMKIIAAYDDWINSESECRSDFDREIHALRHILKYERCAKYPKGKQCALNIGHEGGCKWERGD
jgi:hypothetical protein